VREVFKSPRHPYTRGLLASMPRLDDGGLRDRSARLYAIPGNVPSPRDLPPGCAFANRCDLVEDACRAALPPLCDTGAGHVSRCLRWSAL
jgi:peptide/nickel transport system ATP-binding protein/oligopeptide transport system ATP-binding protein